MSKINYSSYILFSEQYKSDFIKNGFYYGPIMMGGHTSEEKITNTFVPELKDDKNIAKNRFELMDI